MLEKLNDQNKNHYSDHQLWNGKGRGSIDSQLASGSDHVYKCLSGFYFIIANRSGANRLLVSVRES